MFKKGANMEKYRPYIAKIAFFVVDDNDFATVGDFLYENTESEYTYRELCEGGAYYEFELSVVNAEIIPGLDVSVKPLKEQGVEIVQVWLDV
jgi:hypothetical protein